MNSAVEPLRYHQFRWLWAGNVFSAAGTFIQAVAGSWLMFELTSSSTWVGLMVASSTLPLLFLALAAGALADMFDRAKLMLIAQLIMGGAAAAMAVLTMADLITPGLLLTLGLILGTGLALNLPAWQALVPDLVPRGLIASAVALNSAAFNAARAIGPAFGGLLVVAYGAGAGFAVNALSYLATIIALVVIMPNLSLSGGDAPRSMASAISIGVRFARFTPAFRNLLSLVGLFAFTSAVVQAVLPVHTEALGGGAGAFGMLYGAMGAGALIGALLRPRLMNRLERSWIPYTITAFGISAIVLGLSPGLWFAGVAMLAIGVFWLLTLATLNATAQLMSPAWIRGRAMSLYGLAFVGILPLGSILSGVVADHVGTAGTLIIFASGTVLLGLASPRFGIPRVDQIESPQFSDDFSVGHEEGLHEGGPVIVINTWTIDPSDLAEFTAVMSQVRLIRLTTGARRWRLYRWTSEPERFSELIVVSSWEEHMAQHRRIDDAAAALLKRARDFDRHDGPRTRHMIAVDVEHPPDFDEMVADHDAMHQRDGSIPETDQGD